MKKLNSSGKLHAVPASFKGKYVIRFTVTSQYTTEKDIERDWGLIRDTAKRILCEEDSEEETTVTETPISINNKLSITGQHKREGLKKKEYGMSLILSNVPMSPKFINGSFAALFDTHDIIMEYVAHLNRNGGDLDGRPIRLSPRRRLRDQSKQLSFDAIRVTTNNTRRIGRAFKQGSLDSKIEEIFENSSFDSDLYESENQEEVETVENDGKRVTSRPVQVGSQCIPLVIRQKYRRKRSLKSPSSEVIDADVNGEDADVDSIDDELIPTNGTYMICRHCGHILDDVIDVSE